MKKPGQLRLGKTARDHKSGAWNRNARNKQERAEWNQDSKRSQNTFPFHTCNGKRNRSINQWGSPVKYQGMK